MFPQRRRCVRIAPWEQRSTPQQFTREDRKRHREKVRKGLDVLARMLTESRFDFERPMAGLEIELNLVDDGLSAGDAQR